MHVAHALLPGVLSLSLAFGCNRSEATDEVTAPVEEAVVSVSTVAVQLHPVPRELVLTGNVVADRQSDLAANAAGRVLSTHVERGQTVKAGDLIAKLDARQAKLSAKAAKAQSKVAREQLQLAQDRYRLGSGTALEVADAQNAVTRAEVDYVSAVYDYHLAVVALEASVGRPLR